MAVYGFTDPGGDRPARQTVKSYESKVRSKPSGSPKGGKGRYASRGAINTAMEAAQYARDQKVMGASFSDLLGQQKELEVKYERSPDQQDYKNYLDKLANYQQALYGTSGSRIEDGRLQFGMGKDDRKFYDAEGRQILSMQTPMLTVQPTLGQAFGDMGRALFSGFNEYIPQSAAVMGPYGLPVGPEGSVPLTSGGYVQRRQGLVPRYLGKGGALGLITGTLKSVKDKYF
jgi:hypothetical protein